YWNKLASGEDDKELYLEICKLAVLSGMEIDKAKRDYDIEAETVIDLVRKNTKVASYKRPSFFKYLKSSQRSGNKSTIKYDDTIETSMQRIVNAIESQKRKSPRTLKKEVMTLMGILPELEEEIKPSDIKRANDIIDKLLEKQTELRQIRQMMRNVSDSEKTAKMYKCREIEYECVKYVHDKMKSKATLYLLVGELETEKTKAHSCCSLLLSSICLASDDFYKLVAETRKPMCSLVYDENGKYEIYGYKHSAVEIK
ncbi:MAG: hypothetical protein IKA02_04460, partial [Clostridia bacterium]|nr:hypothetical protein [Clostridia bacterium]